MNALSDTLVYWLIMIVPHRSQVFQDSGMELRNKSWQASILLGDQLTRRNALKSLIHTTISWLFWSFTRYALCTLDYSMIHLRKKLSSDERENRRTPRKPWSDIEIDWNSTCVYRSAGKRGWQPLHHRIWSPIKHIIMYYIDPDGLNFSEHTITGTGTLAWNRMNLQFAKQLIFFSVSLCMFKWSKRLRGARQKT